MFPVEDTTQIVFGLPLLGWLFAWFFKVDELVARTRRISSKPRLMPRTDALGYPLCMDPDGRIFVPVRKRVATSETTRVIKFRPERRQTIGEFCFAGVDRRAA